MAKRKTSKHQLTNIEIQKGVGVGGRVVFGAFTAFVLVIALGGWAATSELSGAVIAPGIVKVDKDLRAVQHLDGGIIQAISVKEGDMVTQGQVLFTLDHTQLRAELQIVRGQLIELLAKRQRLTAERDQLSELQNIEGYDELVLASSNVLAGEIRLFKGNRDNRTSQIDQLKLGINQLEEELNGLAAQKKANDRELKIVEAEADKVQKLQSKGLLDGSRVYNSSRDLTKLNGEIGQIEANIARSKSRRSEMELQILAIDGTARNDAQKQLSDIEPRISELLERRSAISARLTRMDIRAPISGIINEIAINTIGGVITPAQKLLTIVPEHVKLQIEVKLQPTDIDQLFVGQPAKLRFSAFSARDTPELNGTIAFLSPATTTDPGNGQIYYVAQIDVADIEIVKLNGKKLIPGMPVETFVQTESRTALSYLARPFTDQMRRAFREQ